MRPDPASRRVVLHFGPPKTGTSALQAWCAAHRKALASHQVHYASFDREDDPKHQWLVKDLRSGRFDRLQSEVGRFSTGTLILSCEGVMVHRHQFAAAHWASFRNILSGCDTALFLVRRRTEDWVRSLWRQSVLNPGPHGGAAVPALDRFARAPPLLEMAALPELAARMAKDCGAGRIVIAPYEGDWLAQFRDLARIPQDVGPDTLPRVHETPPDDFVQLYRVLAAGQADVGPLRRALFALYCRAMPTTNLTLQHSASDFALSDPAEQSRHLTDLAARLGVLANSQSPTRQLAESLARSATDWLARL